MKNLKNLLKTPLQIIPKWVPIALLVLALVGFADATYLTIEHYQNEIPPCAISGCETVLTSAYSSIAGIPVSLLGSLTYLILIVLLLLYLDTKKEIFLRIALPVSFVAALASVAFLLIMAFVLKAFCQYCAVSDAISITIFFVLLWLALRSRNSSLPVRG